LPFEFGDGCGGDRAAGGGGGDFRTGSVDGLREPALLSELSGHLLLSPEATGCQQPMQPTSV
jgi:hypothetical protein